MMGIGFWIMLLLLAVPIMLVVGLLVLMIRPLLGHAASRPPATGQDFGGAPASVPTGPGHALRSGMYLALVAAAFLLGLLVSYWAWAGDGAAVAGSVLDGPPAADIDLDALRAQINPPQGYRIGVRYGDLGPRLLAAGVIDYDALAALYDRAGRALDAHQIDALVRGSDEEVVITQENSHFLLNFFWAVGLANRNSLLTEGPMVQYSDGQIERFASTGGWSLASRPVVDVYASIDLIPLTSEQQSRLEQAAAAVYRPCCGNPTSFPDCNHGMAMLGLLELMASQNATLNEMFTAAKYVNAYWFPDQAFEVALYLKKNRDLDFASADPRMLTGAGFASGSGFAEIHQDLEDSGILPPPTRGSGNCAN